MPTHAHFMVARWRRGPRRRRAGQDPARNHQTKDITGGLARVVELFEGAQAA